MDQGNLVCQIREVESTCPGQPGHLGTEVLTQHVSVTAPVLPKDRSRAFLWGMGGTILSVLSFVAMIGFEQYSGMLSELRNDLKHFNETSADYVKKDSFQRFRDLLRDCYKQTQAANLARAQLEEELKESKKARQDLERELQHLREQLAYVEGRQMAAPHFDSPASAKK